MHQEQRVDESREERVKQRKTKEITETRTMITQTPIMKDGNRRSNQNIMIVQCANNARAFASPKLID